MTTHPMVPTNEQLKKWEDLWFEEGENVDVLLIEAYQAGADQELEDCHKWVSASVGPRWSIALHDARRPKPPSLADEALKTVQKISKNGYPCNYQNDADWDTIVRALELLKKLEGETK